MIILKPASSSSCSVLVCRNYYKEEALLRHEESLDTIFLLLQNLNNFNFVLVLKDKELERPHYWDFVPISGYDLRCGMKPVCMLLTVVSTQPACAYQKGLARFSQRYCT